MPQFLRAIIMRPMEKHGAELKTALYEDNKFDAYTRLLAVGKMPHVGGLLPNRP